MATTLSRVEALQAPGGFFAATSERRLTFLQVFCWAQVLMMVTNLGRIPVLSTEERDFPIAFNELALASMLVAGFFCLSSWKAVRVDRVSIIALLFAMIGAGSAVWSVERFGMTPLDLVVSLSYLARWLMYFALYVTLINVVRLDGIETLWWAVETMLVGLALFGIFQSAFLPGFAQMVYSDNRSFNWDEQGRRLVSTVLEPNIAATMLMIGTLVHAARISVGATVRGWKVLVIFVALVLTISRSAAVGMVFGLMVIFAARGLSRRLLRVMAAAGALGLLASPFLIRYLLAYQKFSVGEGSSAAARLSGWLETLRIVSDYPLFGIGFNAYRYAVESYGVKILGASSFAADGGLLFIMAMTGIFGLASYCGMLGLIIARCRSIWREPSFSAAHRGLALGTAAATVAVVIASTFVNALLTTFVMEMLWVLWAATFVIASSRERRRLPRAQARPLTLVMADLK